MSSLQKLAISFLFYFVFYASIFGQKPPYIDLQEKYPPNTSLNTRNLEQYGLDIKEMIKANHLKEAINHAEEYFIPQIPHLKQSFPEQLLTPLVWINFLFSTSPMYDAKAVEVGELYLSITRLNPDWSSPEDKFRVMWRTAIGYRSLSETSKCQNLIDNCFNLLDHNDLPDESGLRGDLFSSLITLKMNNRQITEAKVLLDSAKIYCSSPEERCYKVYMQKKAEYLERTNQREKAANFLIDFVKEIDQNPETYSSTTRFNVLTNLAKIYYYDGQYNKTIKYYKEALNTPDLGKQQYFSAFSSMGTTYSWLGEYQKAEEYLKKALIQINFETNAPFPYDNNESDLQSLLIVFYFLAQNEQFHYANGGTLDDLKASHHYQEQYLDLLEHMSKNLSPTSSRYFIDRFYFMYEEAVYVRYKLHEETRDPNYLQEAFEVAGRAKAIHVREAAQNTAAEQVFPSELLQRRHDLRKDYVSLENQLYEQRERDNSATKSLADSALLLKNAYFAFLDSLERAYPNMQQMWDIPKPPALEEVQEQLQKDNRAMLQYFIGYQYIFTFLLDGKEVTLQQTKIPEGLSENVNTMRDALYEWALNPSPELVERYTQSAHWLYQQLLEPLDSLLPLRLLIVPDNYVAYLPFDVLLKEEPDIQAPFSAYPYLIRDHQISYAYSPYDFIQNDYSPRYRKSEVLGFAPAFGEASTEEQTVANRRREFGPLIANKLEVGTISEYFTTQMLEDEAATKEAFLKNASKYQVIHLATHAKANDKKGEYSYLCFAEAPGDTTQSNRLYARELYLMDLSADMVVLSACETGLGELSKGEGVISLSQAFSKAGAQSLITTLWRVSDQASAQLMGHFYEQLHTGASKDAALRNAKLHYLGNASGQAAHPFFWAGYIAQGNMTPLSVSSGDLMLWICLFLLGLFVILGGLIRSKRLKTHAKN